MQKIIDYKFKVGDVVEHIAQSPTLKVEAPFLGKGPFRLFIVEREAHYMSNEKDACNAYNVRLVNANGDMYTDLIRVWESELRLSKPFEAEDMIGWWHKDKDKIKDKNKK